MTLSTGLSGKLGEALLCSLFSCAILSASPTQLPQKPEILKPALQEKILSSPTPIPVILHFKDNVDENLIDPLEISSRLRPKMEFRTRRLRRTGHVFNIKAFQLQPAIAAAIDSEALRTLLDDPDLTRIEADESWTLHTEEGIELCGGTILHEFGFKGTGAAIAIIDTGVDPFHPALGGAPIPNSKIVRGLDTADGDEDPQDCSGHGTAVASIAAGVSYQWSPNSYFAGGMAPGAKILAYKAASDNACDSLRESAVIEAVEDALSHAQGADYRLVAINLSGGAGHYSGTCDDENPAMSATVHLATANGIAVIASAGNNGYADGIAAPACLRDVISVGSVWDSQAGLSGSFFCLNGDCSQSCDDAFKKATEPTCYANSGPELDLLAPSEYLLAAQAGGQTTSFGGTSGAAPYVSGAAAVLYRAFPSITPENLRLRLKASGLLRTDPKNNRSTPMLNALEALSTRTALNKEGRRELKPSPDGSFHSEIQVEDAGEIGELRLLLHLRHPHPSSLKISLRGPDGTTIRVEDHPADLARDLRAYYPVDRQSHESLNPFSGRERRGLWELLIEDDQWVPSSSLESWALHFSDPIPLNENPESWSQLTPIVARGPGAGGTHWTSDILLFNPSSYVPAELQVYFIPGAGREHSEILQKVLLLPGRRLLRIDDLLLNLFDLNSGSGELVLRTSGQALFSSVTISTEDRKEGRYGQYIMPTDEYSSTKQYLGYLAGGPSFRTNVGISELSGLGCSGSLQLYNTDGTSIGEPINFQLGAYELVRLDRILEHFAPGIEDAWGIVESDGGIQAWASVVDEGTGDATFIPAESAIESSSWTLPVIARNKGRAQSLWRSELRILNPGNQEIDLQLEFRPGSEAEVLRETLKIGARRLMILSDPVLEVFNRMAGSGPLRILTEQQPTPKLILSSRIYDQTERGSYGQAIPAASTGLQGPSTIIKVEDSSSRHSNLLLTDLTGSGLSLQLELRDPHDLPLAPALNVTIPAWNSLQINDLLDLMGIPGREDSRLEISPADPDSRYLALLSIVDEISGDAISVPAIEERE